MVYVAAFEFLVKVRKKALDNSGLLSNAFFLTLTRNSNVEKHMILRFYYVQTRGCCVWLHSYQKIIGFQILRRTNVGFLRFHTKDFGSSKFQPTVIRFQSVPTRRLSISMITNWSCFFSMFAPTSLPSTRVPQGAADAGVGIGMAGGRGMAGCMACFQDFCMTFEVLKKCSSFSMFFKSMTRE